MKTFDIIVLILGYTLFWTFLIWILMGIVAALFWYSLFLPKRRNFFQKGNRKSNL
ncbi:hypothetical protein [Leptospira noguchii]|uniref:Uncharacterized protein n=2 Tax=Leptospira noguchii TaxID=28182 RepID=T0GY88_9LEPT|nr:hypothetical protein [Leptospira noguchii]EMO52760.1 hypothetical protein LEP1GSC172_2963 [Leptospira noguchii]EQA73917.1 hypothetical protein LEP1GSC059_4009 [Leptospira noguchii serovar Panama str. CZ214]